MPTTADALLATIAKDLFADGPRAVYGDWLNDHGDPRGELVALQLAGSWDAKKAAREKALLKQHATAWAGTLDEWLEPRARLFHRGLLARATLMPGVPASAFRDPAWRLLDVVVLPGTNVLMPELLAALNPRARVCNATASQLAAVAASPVRGVGIDADFRRLKPVELKGLEWLGLPMHAFSLSWARRSGAFGTVPRLGLWFDEGSSFEGWGDALAGDGFESVELFNSWDALDGWTFELRGRPFTEATATYRGPVSWRLLNTFRVTVGRFPKTLKSLVVRTPLPLKLSEENLRELETVRRRFKLERYEAPWHQPTLGPKPATGERVLLELWGDVSGPKRLERVARFVTEDLQVPIDSAERGLRIARIRDLGETLGKLSDERGRDRVDLRSNATDETLVVEHGNKMCLDMHLRSDAKGLLDTLAALFDEVPIDKAFVRKARAEPPDLRTSACFTSAPGGWLMMFGQQPSMALDDAAMTRVLAKSRIKGAVFKRAGGRLLVALGPSPGKLTPAGFKAFDRALADALATAADARLGFQWKAVVEQALGVEADRGRGFYTALSLSKGDRKLHFGLWEPLGAPRLNIWVARGMDQQVLAESVSIPNADALANEARAAMKKLQW